MTVSVEEITLDIPGLRLAGRAWGDDDGLPLLALHGWLDNCASFDPLAALLPGMRLVAVDLPGHGRSDHRHASAEYHYVNWVADTFAAADALGWGEFSILGHSMGAGVALLAAGGVPERIRRVVALEGLGPLTTRPKDGPDALHRAVTARHNFEASRTARTYSGLEEAAQRKADAIGIERESAFGLTERTLVQVDGGFRYGHDPRLRHPSLLRFTEAQVLAFLRRVDAPVMVVRAKSGPSYDEAVLQRRLDALDDVRFIEVEGGHHLHLESPSTIAPDIHEFLNEPE